MSPDKVNLLLEKAHGPLAVCYLLCAAANLAIAARACARARLAAEAQPKTAVGSALRVLRCGFCALCAPAWTKARAGRAQAALAALWLLWAAGFAAAACLAWQGRPPELPEGLKRLIDAAMHPAVLFCAVLGVWLLFYLLRRWLVAPAAGWLGLNVVLLWLGASFPDPEFAAIVAAPDNVAILLMALLLAFFLWAAAAQAVENDRRLAKGKLPVEQVYRQRVLVWPDLIYAELIAAILVTVGLLLWALAVPAPLEGPANPTLTPNPAKAPWYFVGLQELLVYSDAWYAGVIVPLLAIFGLAAIPYLDVSPAGNGYYSIHGRRLAWLVFHFGFLQMWVLMILIGALLRGPNWTLFGLYEARYPARIEPLAELRLSEWFWTALAGRTVPQAAADASRLARTGTLLLREIAGIVLLAVYFVGLPLILGRTLLAPLRGRMGRGRYVVMLGLLLCILILPVKMILRWVFGLSYIVSFPEWSLSL